MEHISLDQLIVAPNLGRDYEGVVLDTFDKLMKGHVGGSAGLVVIDSDPDTYPEQRMDVVGIKRDLSDIATVRGLAKAAYKHSPDVESQFLERQDLLNNIVMDILSGQDINVVYDHPSIINIAIGGAALRGALFTFAHKELGIDLGTLKEDLIISKGVTKLAAFGSIPAPRVLRSVWQTYFSLPPSRKVRGSDIPKDVRQDFNEAMLSIYQDDEIEASPEGTIHTVAGSGQTDVVINKRRMSHKKKTVHMGPLANGSVSLMMRCRSLPVGLTLGEQEPILTIGHLKNPIKEAKDAHGIMSDIAAMNEKLTGDEYHYHPTRESLEAALA
jgi:hypothetical protein